MAEREGGQYYRKEKENVVHWNKASGHKPRISWTNNMTDSSNAKLKIPTQELAISVSNNSEY